MSGILKPVKLRVRISSQNLQELNHYTAPLTNPNFKPSWNELLPLGSRMNFLSIGFLNHTPKTMTKRFKETAMINLSRKHDEETNAWKEYKVLPLIHPHRQIRQACGTQWESIFLFAHYHSNSKFAQWFFLLLNKDCF